MWLTPANGAQMSRPPGFSNVVGLSKKTRWLRDFCVTQWCFVVLLDEIATDIPRAWLLRINYFQ